MKPIGKCWQNIPLSSEKAQEQEKQVSKERLQKNAVNAMRQSTGKPIAVDRQHYRHPCPRLPAFRRAVLRWCVELSDGK